MATERAHQLGSMASLRKHFPARKTSTRYTTKPPAGLPEFEMLKPSGKNNGIVIAITEARSTTSEVVNTPREAEVLKEEVHQAPARPPPLTIPLKAHVIQERKPETPSSPLLQSPPLPRAPSAADVPLPRSSTSTQTLVRSGSNASMAVHSPVMQSIFPRYNPNVPLAQQHYYPNMDIAPTPAYTRTAPGSSAYTPCSQRNNGSQTVDGANVEGRISTTAGFNESPLRRSESLRRSVTFSTPGELLELWSIANGQGCEEAEDSYTLELSCDDLTLNHEIITFNTTSSQAIYTLSASPTALTITRTHPMNRNLTIPICASTISQPTCQDPLVTSIFPELAGLMAVDQSSSLAVSKRLTRSVSDLLQAKAIAHAQEREASMLLWDSDSNKYCLMHPTLLDSTATTLPIVISPTPAAPETITIYAPETSTPLLSLSLQTLCLTLHSSALTALPSLYILDTLMITLLTLLLHLHRSCAEPPPTTLTPEMPIFPPPPSTLHSPSSPCHPSINNHRTLSLLSVFRPKPPHRDRDIELADLNDPPSPRAVENTTKSTRHHAPPESFPTNDPALPKGTRAALKLLYWTFELVFWALSLAVRVLAAAVVGAGRLIARL